MKKESFWKQRPSKKSESYIVILVDLGMKIAFGNPIVSNFAEKMDDFICRNVKKVPAPQWMYDLEKPSKPYVREPIEYASGFRGEVERYAMAKTQEKQNKAIAEIAKRKEWMAN